MKVKYISTVARRINGVFFDYGKELDLNKELIKGYEELFEIEEKIVIKPKKKESEK